jgi:antitoxin (DNA-binding transcriptional repressor) of toxin-antitoxin stability system
MIDRKRIVIVTKAGKPVVAFIGLGRDAARAQEVFEAETKKAENDAVELFIYPQPAKIRFPSRDVPVKVEKQPVKKP